MTRPASPEGYILSEMEVWGRGGPVAVPKPAAPAEPGRTAGSGGRRVAPPARFAGGGRQARRFRSPGFDDRDWMVATVPGTVLASYFNAGAIPDPNYGDNQLMISDSFFYADFWYRDEFVAAGRRPRASASG